MGASHIVLKSMEGQAIMINLETKVLITELNEMFRHARQVLKWDEKYGNLAFGINRSIINLIIGSKMKLLIRFLPNPSQEYWINYDELHKFIKAVPCLTNVTKTTQIYNIPVLLFTPKPNFSGVKQDG